jgi:hypothetical protein
MFVFGSPSRRFQRPQARRNKSLRDGIPARPRGRETIRVPLRDIPSRWEIAKPLRVRVLLDERVSDVGSEPVADSRVIEFPVK